MKIMKIFVLIAALVIPGILNAQGCLASITETTPTSRFTDNNDGTITDNVTFLVWKRCPEGLTFENNNTTGNITDDSCSGSPLGLDWQEALQYVETLNNASGYAGKNNWRLPSIKELASIVELSCNNPAINLTIFPNTPTTGTGAIVDRYATSSTEVSLSAYYRAINFDLGEDAWYGRSNTSYIRLVRTQ